MFKLSFIWQVWYHSNQSITLYLKCQFKASVQTILLCLLFKICTYLSIMTCKNVMKTCPDYLKTCNCAIWLVLFWYKNNFIITKLCSVFRNKGFFNLEGCLSMNCGEHIYHSQIKVINCISTGKYSSYSSCFALTVIFHLQIFSIMMWFEVMTSLNEINCEYSCFNPLWSI